MSENKSIDESREICFGFLSAEIMINRDLRGKDDMPIDVKFSDWRSSVALCDSEDGSPLSVSTLFEKLNGIRERSHVPIVCYEENMGKCISRKAWIGESDSELDYDELIWDMDFDRMIISRK